MSAELKALAKKLSAVRKATIHNESGIYKRLQKLERQVRDALDLASSHDPDITDRINMLERQVERLGAPAYRVYRSSKGSFNNGIYVERRRKNVQAR